MPGLFHNLDKQGVLVRRMKQNITSLIRSAPWVEFVGFAFLIMISQG